MGNPGFRLWAGCNIPNNTLMPNVDKKELHEHTGDSQYASEHTVGY